MKGKFQYIMFGAVITLLAISATLVFSLHRTSAAKPINDRETVQPASDFPVNLQLLNQRENLSDDWKRKMTEQSGWLHIIVHYVQNDEPSTMPNGIIIPNDYISDSWYLLDENQTTTTMLDIMRDKNGNIIQFGTFQDGILFNSALESAFEVSEPPTDFAVSTPATQNNVVNQEIITQDGREVLITTVREKFSPVILDDLDGALASGIITQDTIDAKTGEPIRTIQTTLLADGTERLLGKSEYVLIERPTTLPQELRDLLEEGLKASQEAR